MFQIFQTCPPSFIVPGQLKLLVSKFPTFKLPNQSDCLIHVLCFANVNPNWGLLYPRTTWNSRLSQEGGTDLHDAFYTIPEKHLLPNAGNTVIYLAL